MQIVLATGDGPMSFQSPADVAVLACLVLFFAALSLTTAWSHARGSHRESLPPGSRRARRFAARTYGATGAVMLTAAIGLLITAAVEWFLNAVG